MLRCICGHASNKHIQLLDVRKESVCIVKGCDCDCWRWDRKDEYTLCKKCHSKTLTYSKNRYLNCGETKDE